MDRDEGNCVGERRWSRAISVTSHLAAQCFNRQMLGQRAEKEESEAVICLDGRSQVASGAAELICLCRNSLLQYQGRASTH